MVRSFYRTGILFLLILTLVCMMPPPAVFADVPGTRGEGEQATGMAQPIVETGGAPSASMTGGQGDSADTRIWQGVSIIPPPTHILAATDAMSLRASAPTQDANGALLPWLNRELNPGNWILDAGMGIFTAITASIGEMFQRSAMSLMGNAGTGSAVAQAGQWSVIPASCADGALYNIIFCTPPELTYAHAGVQNVWSVLRAVATALVTLLFLVRIGRMMGDGSRALAAEAKPLVVTFVFVTLFVQGTEWVCQYTVDFFNAISNSILANASFALPAQGDTPFNIGAAIMALFFWLLVLILTLKSLFRVIGIAVLIGVAPLAGAMLMDRTTASRFRSWLEKLIELLLEQISVVIVMAVAAAMLTPIQGASRGDQFVQFLMGTLTMVSALFGPSAMVGIASGAGGGYLAPMLQMRLIGAVQKAGVAGGKVAAGAALAGGAAALGKVAGVGGDPTLSAAARRMGHRVALQTGKDDTRRRDHFAFRMPAVDPGKDNRSLQRYELAGVSGGQSAQRSRARVRADAMTAQAAGLERAGQSPAAQQMRRRAQLQRAFAAGQDLARTPRWGTGMRDPETGRIQVSQRGQERRAIYSQALSETRAQHDAERSWLREAIASDQRLLAAPSDMGGDQRQAHERLVANEARLRALSATKAADGTRYDVAPVTRREAALLAQQRWTTDQAKRRTERQRPSIVRLAQRAEAGIPPNMRRVAGPALTARPRRSIQPIPPRRTSLPPRPESGSDMPASPRLRDMTPEARATHVRARASHLGDVQRRRAGEAASQAWTLRTQAQTTEGEDPAQAAALRRQAQDQADAYHRHTARASAYQTAAQGAITRASLWTAEQRDARRSAFQSIREEVLREAARRNALPEAAPDANERLQRAKQIGTAVRHRAHDRLGDLAGPQRPGQ